MGHTPYFLRGTLGGGGSSGCLAPTGSFQTGSTVILGKRMASLDILLLFPSKSHSVPVRDEEDLKTNWQFKT